MCQYVMTVSCCVYAMYVCSFYAYYLQVMEAAQSYYIHDYSGVADMVFDAIAVSLPPSSRALFGDYTMTPDACDDSWYKRTFKAAKVRG